MKKLKIILLSLLILSFLIHLLQAAWGGEESLVAPGAEIETVGEDFKFTEGPAVDAKGDLFFTDIPATRIYKLPLKGKLTVFRENTGGANGLFFDKKGNLLACEGNNHRVVSIAPDGEVTVLADKYNDKQFNKPNDLWIDPKGGVYFSDPLYGRKKNRHQDGEHVYYITPVRKDVIRVIDDMVRPNGIIGTPDGKTLYVADHGGKKTYKYKINRDGTLSGKELFVSKGSDGMTIDDKGNIYLTSGDLLIFNPDGKMITKIDIPQKPTNVCFGGKDMQTLFITARKGVYYIRMKVKGVSYFKSNK